MEWTLDLARTQVSKRRERRRPRSTSPLNSIKTIVPRCGAERDGTAQPQPLDDVSSLGGALPFVPADAPLPRPAAVPD